MLTVPCCTRLQCGKSEIGTVKRMEEEFNQVWSEYTGLREGYNSHLVDLHRLDRSNADSLSACCEVDMIDYPEDINSLSSSGRLELLRQAVEIVAGCAFDFERLFMSHMVEFHDPLDYRWEKFYSPVSESLAFREKLAAVERSNKSLVAFVSSLRAFYEEHIQMHF